MVVDLGTFDVCHEDSPASNGGMPSSHKARPSRFRRFLVRQRFLCYVCVCVDLRLCIPRVPISQVSPEMSRGMAVPVIHVHTFPASQ
jgi:hypothetical protein